MKSHSHTYAPSIVAYQKIEHEVKFPEMETIITRTTSGNCAVAIKYTDPATGDVTRANIEFPKLFRSMKETLNTQFKK